MDAEERHQLLSGHQDRFEASYIEYQVSPWEGLQEVILFQSLKFDRTKISYERLFLQIFGVFIY